MKISSEKIDDLNQVLTVKVASEDYAEARRKKLAEFQRRAEVPGFRKGKVPASLIEKWYGESVLGETVNNVVGDAIQNYIETEKLNVIGEPLPVEEQPEQEWKAGNDFEFKFDMALSPKVNFDFDKKDEVPFYNINVTEAEKKKLVDAFKKQQEAAEKAAAQENREAPQAQSEEELVKMAAEQLANEYKQAANYRLEKDIKDFCINKAGIALPEKFLRRWLIAVNKDKFTEEQIDKDFEGFLADYRWQLIMTELSKKFGVKVEDADLKEEALNFARYQYSMYGLGSVPDEMLDDFAGKILKDENYVQRMVENVQFRKVIAEIKDRISVKPKKISLDKFRELNK